MGQVVKLCNNLIYAAQMLATSEATALALTSGVDMAKLHEVLTHATGDCVAVRTRLPVAGVVPESPASNGWRPGFMTDLMAKDLDLALAYGARAGVPLTTTAVARQALTAAIGRRVRPGGLLLGGQGRPRPVRSRGREPVTVAGRADGDGKLLVLAADHRPRGVPTIERYGDYLAALRSAVAQCDGILATAQPLGDLAAGGGAPAGPAHLPLAQPDRPGRLGLRTRRPAGGDAWTGRPPTGGPASS